MIRAKSWKSPLDVKYDKPNAPQEPIRRALNPARLVPSASGDSPRSETIIGGRSADEEHTFSGRLPSTTQSIQSQQCTASTAARIRQAKFKAAERLAAIEMLRLQLEAELVHKKLEADIAILRSYSEGVTNTNCQVEDRMRHVDPAQSELIYDSLPARDNRTPLAAAPPVRPVTNNTEPKPNRYSKDAGVISSTENHRRTEKHSQQNSPELLRPTKDTLALRIKNVPRPVTRQNHEPTTRKVSSAIRTIFDQQVLTGSRNKPAASLIELGWVIHGTTPRMTTSNEDDEHVFHQRAKNRYEFLDALARPLEADAENISLKPMFHALIQKEEEIAATKQVKQAVQLQLPRYCNTRGVRTFDRPVHEIRGEAFAAKGPLQTRTIAVKHPNQHPVDPNVTNENSANIDSSAKELVATKIDRKSPSIEMYHIEHSMKSRHTSAQDEACAYEPTRSRSGHLIIQTWKRLFKPNTTSWPDDTNLNPSHIDSYEQQDSPSDLCEPRELHRLPGTPKHSEPSTAVEYSGRSVQTFVVNGIRTSTHCKLPEDVNLHYEPHVNYHNATIRTRGGVYHRTKKKLAVLTRNMKLRESFAEGRMLRTGA